jgi:hypothetical protein
MIEVEVRVTDTIKDFTHTFDGSIELWHFLDGIEIMQALYENGKHGRAILERERLCNELDKLMRLSDKDLNNILGEG